MDTANASRKTEFRLFLSSTFRDLQEEREYLIKKVFPEIRAVCRLRGVTFTEVDLRWGLTDEQQRLGRIVRTCMEEIERCKPYFIGILGKRYGWTPEYHEVLMDPDIQDRFPWIEEISLGGGSILEMEFSSAIRNGDPNSTYFYRRTDDPASFDNIERLEELIGKVGMSGMPLKSFDRPEELGELVRSDILAMIEASWPAGSVPTPLETERLAHETFAHSRRRAYIPNAEYLLRFNQWRSSETTPLLISAESGMGKSALMAWLIGEYRRKNPDGFIIEHYIGASDDSTDHLGFIRRLIGEIQLRYGISEDIPTDSDGLERAFIEWLDRVGNVEGFEGDELVIALDAADQLLPHSRSFSWLPKTFQSKIRLIVSCKNNETLQKLLERNWERLELRQLSEREREAIIARYLGEYHKELPSTFLQRIGRDEKAASPLFLRTLAEELRLHGEHETLAGIIDDYLGVGNLEELFMKTLQRMERDYGVRIVRSVTVALAVSRAGLAETHLLGASHIARVELSMLLNALDYHLLRSNGRIHFFHNYLRRAIEARYLSDSESIRKEHRALGSFFNSEFTNSLIAKPLSVDPSVVREMLYQHFMAENREALQQALLSPVVFDLMFDGETEYEFLRYWKSLGENDLGELYEISFANSADEDLSEEKITERLIKLAHLFRVVGLWDAAEYKLKEAVERSERNNNIKLSLKALGEYGDLLILKGKYNLAYQAYGKKLALAQSNGLEDIAAIAAGDIGGVLLEQGEYDKAMEKFEIMLASASRNNNRRDMTRAQMKIAQIHLSKNEYGNAMSIYKNCLEFFESQADKRQIASVLGQIGLVHWNTGEFESAMQCFRNEMECMKDIGDSHGYAKSIGKIGLVELDHGDFTNASDNFREYLRITKELGYSRGIGFAYGDIGILYFRQEQFSQALEYFELGLVIHRQINFPEGVAMWLRWIAETILESFLRGEAPLENLTKALQANTESMNIAKSIGSKDMLQEAEIVHARLLNSLGERSRSKELLLNMIPKISENSRRADVHYWIWRLYDGVDNNTHKESAMRFYRALSERTKKYSYAQRLKELGQKVYN